MVPAEYIPRHVWWSIYSNWGRTSTVRMPFGVYKMRSHWRNLTNTIEASVCSGDAALYQITLTGGIIIIPQCLEQNLSISAIFCKNLLISLKWKNKGRLR